MHVSVDVAFPGAKLKFSDVASATTGSDGRYHIDLPGNYYTIYGSADGFLSTMKDLTVNKDFPAVRVMCARPNSSTAPLRPPPAMTPAQRQPTAPLVHLRFFYPIVSALNAPRADSSHQQPIVTTACMLRFVSCASYPALRIHPGGRCGRLLRPDCPRRSVPSGLVMERPATRHGRAFGWPLVSGVLQPSLLQLRRGYSDPGPRCSGTSGAVHPLMYARIQPQLCLHPADSCRVNSARPPLRQLQRSMCKTDPP